MSAGAGPPIESKLAAAVRPVRLRYLYIYSFVFESPSWKLNLLYGFLCHLSGQVVPVIGPLVYLGYTFDVMESVIRHPERTYPDFDPAKFSHYLQRSLAPFLVLLVSMAPAAVIAAVIWALEFAGILAAAAAAGKNAAPFILLGGLGLGFATVTGVLMLSFIPAMGFFIRSGLTQDLTQGLNLRWSLDFMKRVWLETVLISVFNIVTLIPLIFLGVACCVVGMFVVQAIDSFATANTCCQLYNLYLARGGEPIPLKDPPIPAVATTAV